MNFVDDNSDSRHDHVSSSTENIMMCSRPTLSAEGSVGKAGSRSRSGSGGGGTQPLDRAYSEPVENLRRQLEHMSDKEAMIRVALETMQQELDTCHNAHSEHLRSMVDAQNVQISEIKKKQWVSNIHWQWQDSPCNIMRVIVL